MSRSLVITAALSVAFGLCTSAAEAGAPSSNASEPCASLVRTLETEIKSLRQLLGNRNSGLDDFAKSKKSKNNDRLTHGREIDEYAFTSTDKSSESRRAAARQREQVDALNGMMPGFGCNALDIDAELKK